MFSLIITRLCGIQYIITPHRGDSLAQWLSALTLTNLAATTRWLPLGQVFHHPAERWVGAMPDTSHHNAWRLGISEIFWRTAKNTNKMKR